MARSKRSSGRYKSGAPFGQRFQQKLDAQKRDKELKKKNPKKYKRQKAIAKASKDGKITQSEAKKLAKKGISLASIRNQNIKEFRQAREDTSRANRNMNRDRRTYDYKSPSFSPLLITKGAERTLSNQQRQPRRPGGGGGGGGGGVHQDTFPSTQPTNQYQSEIEDILGGEPDQQLYGQPVADPVADALASLQQTIAGIQMPDYAGQFDAMRIDQENYMREMADRQAAYERQRELAFRTSQENTARGGLTPDFRIGARSPRDQFGTGGFKRRPRRRAAVVAQGITPVQQTINNMVPNTLQTRGINT